MHACMQTADVSFRFVSFRFMGERGGRVLGSSSLFLRTDRISNSIPAHCPSSVLLPDRADLTNVGLS